TPFLSAGAPTIMSLTPSLSRSPIRATLAPNCGPDTVWPDDQLLILEPVIFTVLLNDPFVLKKHIYTLPELGRPLPFGSALDPTAKSGTPSLLISPIAATETPKFLAPAGATSLT